MRQIGLLSVTALMLLTVAVQGVAAGTTQRVAPARTIQFCVPGKQLTGAISRSREVRQGSLVTLALTNRSAECKVTGALWAQFHGAKGGAIGPIANAPALAEPRIIHKTFQLVAGIVDAFGPVCSRAIEATSVQIGIDGTSVRVPLKASQRICVQPYFSERLGRPSFPVPAPCTPGQLVTRAGFSQGAAGTLYTELLFINVSHAACVVGGFPLVQGVDGEGGVSVGAPAQYSRAAGPGLPVIDLNHTGARTFAQYGRPDAGIFSPGYCGPMWATGVEVSILGQPSTYLSLPGPICTRINAAFVSHVAIG